MIEAVCHCGAARLEVARAPRRLTDCKCSLCRRYGALWANYKAGAVRLKYRKRDVQAYSWGDRKLRFVRVNARNMDPAVIARVRVRHLDGAKTWKFLD